MSINLVTYANQTVTPTNDAIIYERAIDQNGIFYGCNVTVSGNEVHITGGYGIVCGREFTIESDAIAVTLAPSGTLDGRLYVRLDLADADAPIQLLTTTGNTLPPLEQDADVNYTNGTWEMELATFTVGVSALSDCAETFETIVGSKALGRIMAKQESITISPAKSVAANGDAEILNNYDVSSIIGNDNVLEGVSFNWASGSACFASNVQKTGDTTIYLRLLNPTTVARSISSVVLTLYYKDKFK